MPYRFKRKESVSKAVRRPGCERVEDADGRGVAAQAAAIERRQRQLRRAAFALGADSTPKPPAFCARLAGGWNAWRHEKSPR